MPHRKMFKVTLLLALLLLPVSALAQEGISVTVVTNVLSCGEVTFVVDAEGGTGPYSLSIYFGDGFTDGAVLDSLHYQTSHSYSGQGDYQWSVVVTGTESSGSAGGTVAIDGPTVTLVSDPDPPLLDYDPAEEATANFTASVTGGVESYAWDLNGGNLVDGAGSASISVTYAEQGTYEASVTVTDACGLTATDTLAVVVGDPGEEGEDGEACHPMAQKIANGVDLLYEEELAEQTYTCEDIFAIFTGGEDGSHFGFGRLWHAVKLANRIEELTWEQILDWRLEGTGWGMLTQLDRYADALDEYGIADLLELVQNGENTIGDVRTALRAVVRHEAEFEDALARLADGANNGELGQFYRAVQDLGVDPEVLDEYLEMGASLSDLRHAAKSAEQTGADLDDMVAARAAGHSWGEIGQAYRLADEGTGAEAILEMGVQEYRSQEREEAQADRESERNQRQEDQIADQSGASEEDVQAASDACDGDTKCMRDYLRNLKGNKNSGGRGKGKGKGKNK